MGAREDFVTITRAGAAGEVIGITRLRLFCPETSVFFVGEVIEAGEQRFGKSSSGARLESEQFRFELVNIFPWLFRHTRHILRGRETKA